MLSFSARTGAAALAVLGFGLSAASAKGPVVEFFNRTNVEKALKELGATDIKFKNDSSLQVFSYRYNTISYGAALSGCKTEKECLALWSTAVYAADSKPYDLKAVNGFNNKNTLVSAVVLKDGRLGVGRQIVSAGGVTMDNVKFNVTLFHLVHDDLVKYFGASGGGAPTVSLEQDALPAALMQEMKSQMELLSVTTDVIDATNANILKSQ